jgi:hypothetical protein
VTAAPAKPTDGLSPAAAGAPASGTWGDDLVGEQWYADRSSACLHSHAVTYKVIETPSGALSGTAEFRIAQETALSTSNTAMDESASVRLVASTGKLAAPKATFSAHCTGTCVTADGSGFTNETFTLNETQDAFFTYTDTPHGTAHTFHLGYTFTVTPPPGTKRAGGAATTSPGSTTRSAVSESPARPCRPGCPTPRARYPLRELTRCSLRSP